jgi:peptidyl-prolyl cis-trans isomerase SurA
MAAYMREAVIPLKPGEISPIIETPTGYQFFKLLSSKEGEIVYQAQLETVKEEIRKKIFEEKFKEEFRNWVDKIKKEAYIKKML